MNESNHGSTKDAPANATSRGGAGPANREWTVLHLWQIQPVKDCLWIVITVFLVWVGYELRSIFTPVLIALGLAYLANPLVDSAEYRWRVPRPAAISLILGVAILTLIALLLKSLEMSLAGDVGLGAWIVGLGGPTVVFLLGQFLESWILTPWLQSTSLNLNAVTVLIAVLVGGMLGGVYGLILAVPVARSSGRNWRCPVSQRGPAGVADKWRADFHGTGQFDLPKAGWDSSPRSSKRREDCIRSTVHGDNRDGLRGPGRHFLKQRRAE